MGRLEGKVAIITGASRGIGEGMARMFAREGARVALAARTQERLERVADEIERDGGETLVVVTDVSRTEDLQRMVEATIERFGALDILISNAAIASFSRYLGDEDLEAEYDRLMATNVKSAFMGIHYALPHLRARGGGSVIHISSVHGTASANHMSAYAASKGALNAATRAMAVELAPDGIRVNSISPGRIYVSEPGGWLRRRLGEALFEEFQARFGDGMTTLRPLAQPLPVAGAPEDVAYCALYLASDEARFVTGATFHVDGGMTAQLADPDQLFPGAYETMRRRAEMRAWMEEARRRNEGP